MKKLFLLFMFCLFINSFCGIGAEEVHKKIDSIHDKKVKSSTLNIEAKIKDDMNSKRLELAMQEKQSEKNIDNKTVKNRKSLLHVILMYLPNRVIDLTDIISLKLGFGPEASCEIIFTEYCQFSASYGDRYFLEKGYNRQYGGGYSSGYNTSYICWRRKMEFTDFTFGTVKPYVIMDQESSIPSPYKKNYFCGIKDFWKIGVHAGWIIDISASLHPLAIANFFTGFFFVRLTDTNEI